MTTITARNEARTEDIFSDSYLEAFYKAHVSASRRSNLDEDIAAIEAEIQKVHQVRTRVQSYRVADNHHLNSCGNSECSDDEENGEVDYEARDSIPTSVFKVYNSTVPMKSSHTKGPDVFSWALQQLVNHDHNYCGSLQQETNTPLAHDELTLNSVKWPLLSSTMRSHTLRKLCVILNYSPANRRSSPSNRFPSLSLIPRTLAESLRTQKGLGVTTGNKTKTRPHPQLDDKKHEPLHTTSLNRSRKTQRFSPYEKRPNTRIMETSRKRNISSCSEKDIEID